MIALQAAGLSASSDWLSTEYSRLLYSPPPCWQTSGQDDDPSQIHPSGSLPNRAYHAPTLCPAASNSPLIVRNSNRSVSTTFSASRTKNTVERHPSRTSKKSSLRLPVNRLIKTGSRQSTMIRRKKTNLRRRDERRTLVSCRWQGTGILTGWCSV